MVKATLEKNRLVLDLTESELKELEFSPNTDFEIVKARKGVWVLLEALQKSKPKIDDSEQKIIDLLRKKDLKYRVEGEFEKLLSPSEQIMLKKLRD